MVFDVSIILTWLLFLALFPMAFIWLRRAWRIFRQKDYSEVALKKGEPPPNPRKWAKPVGLVNLIAGLILVWIIIGVPFWVATGVELGPFTRYEQWSALAGSTIWLKIIADFIISRQAHPFPLGRNKNQKKG
jgi:amino acid transporter